MLNGGAVLAATTSLSACDFFSTDPGTDAESGTEPKGKEAPELADRVEAGDLPPVADRLPDEPLVIEPEESVGVYGGEWLTCILNVGGSDAYANVGYDALTRWDVQWSDVEPNLAESWEVIDDGREYVFHLRSGLKWSDGEPFTGEDILFAYEAVLLNTELTPESPEWLLAAGELPEIELDDKLTVRFLFSEPHGLLPEWLATPSGAMLTAVPRHFLAEFHADHGDNVDQLVDQEGFDTWMDLFTAKGGVGPNDIGAWQVPELPTMYPWKVTTPLTNNRLVVERNPYYWKTDPDGSQLPYLDRVVLEVVRDSEVVIVQVSEGKYNLPVSDILTPANKPVLAQNRESGGYSFHERRQSKTNFTTITLNQNSKDPALRDVFRNKDFRIGLSYALNRQEIIDTAYQQQGEPWQNGPARESDYYDETLAKQYTEFDPELAEDHLDRTGYTERDSEGFRLGPDGNRIAFTVEVPIGFDPTWPDVVSMIQTYWADVGVDIRIESEQTDLFFTRTDANEHDAVLYSGENGLIDAILDPRWYFPYNNMSLFAPLWAAWYNSGGSAGEEPSEAAQRQMSYYDQVRASIDPDEQQELFMQVLAISAEEFYVIGTALSTESYQVVRDDFKNVPQSFPDGWLFPDPAPLHPEQFYISS